MNYQIKIPDHLDTYDYKSIKNTSLIHALNYYEKPKPIFSMEINCDTIDVMSQGNLSMIKGAAKSRKTFTMMYLLKLILNENMREVTIFDTEQYNYHSCVFTRRVKQLTPHHDKLTMYNIRKYSKGVRIQFIQDYIEHNRPDLVFIDNIRDVIADFNDIGQSDAILTLLSQLSEEYKTHICVTLHVNKANNYARGHLGSELEQKCETVIEVTTANDITTVAPALTRNRPFPAFSFSIINGLPEEVAVNNITQF